MRWEATNSEGYPAPVGIVADVVVLTTRAGALQVLLVRRPDDAVSLPGGFVGRSETAGETAVRQLQQKTGLRDVYLEQLAAFTDPGRDPRGWIPSVAHVALVPSETEPTDPNARWEPAVEPPILALDHN